MQITTPIDIEKMAGVNRLLVGSPERSRGLLARRSRQNTALAPLPPPRMSSRQVATIWKISDTSNSPTNQCQRITADESLRLSTSRPCRRTSHHGTSQRRLRHDASSCPGFPNQNLGDSSCHLATHFQPKIPHHSPTIRPTNHCPWSISSSYLHHLEGIFVSLPK